MILSRSPKLAAYAVLALVGFMGGLALGRPEPALLGAPFFLALIAGLSLVRQPEISMALWIDGERVMEGDEVGIKMEIMSSAPVAWLEVLLDLPSGLELVNGRDVIALTIVEGTSNQLSVRVHCRHWGGYLVGAMVLRARDRLGLFVFEVRLELRRPLRVYPRPEALRSLPRPAQTQVYAGNELSSSKGDGIEFTDIRPFVPGDRVQRINWRLSTRRNELFVNEHLQERNADVILFLDSFAAVERDGESTHLMAVRGAATLAEHYLQRRNRVGFVGFGGTLRWLLPSMGLVQHYRIVESLIDTDIVLSYAWRGLGVIPAPTLPPQSFVVAFTPLLDERAIHALLDLRGRGFDLAIVEISPVDLVPPPVGDINQIAHRLWLMERESLRDRFRRLGVAVGVWDTHRPLEAVLMEVQEFRRYARRTRA